MNFSGSLTKKEALAALLYLPVHMLLLPLLMLYLSKNGVADDPVLVFGQYAVGAVYMLIMLGGFLRREFDALCDRPFRSILTVIGAYLGTMYLTVLAGLLLQLVPGTNLNNAAVADMATENMGVTAATAVFLAPLVEEPIFRAGIFGQLRKKNRALAYAVGALAFSLYHVVGYAGQNPLYLIYAVQYIPASLMLMLCYEKTNSLWSSIFLHMLINGVSLNLLGSL